MIDTDTLKEFWRRYKKSRAGIVGLFVILFFALTAIFSQSLTPHDPDAVDFSIKFSAPGAEHFLGTDNFGRDVLSRIIAGTKMCFIVGAVAASISSIVGIIVGAISGYYGAWIDDILMRITEMFLVIPTFFLILLIVAVFGTNIWLAVFAIGITSWPQTARLLRASFLSLKEHEFVEASRLAGAGDVRIILRILPNALAPVIVMASIQVAAAILMEASLSFLGLGDVNVVTWGQMLYRAQIYLRTAWWMATFPGLAIFIIVLSFNVVGDALNDALNPRLKEVGVR